MTVLDASVWVSWLVRSDVHHGDTVAWVESLLQSGADLFAPTITLAEVASVVRRVTGIPSLGIEAMERVTNLSAVTLVDVGGPLGRESGRIAARLSLRGMDAIYVATAHSLGVPLVTWDDEQLQRGVQLIEVRTPS